MCIRDSYDEVYLYPIHHDSPAVRVLNIRMIFCDVPSGQKSGHQGTLATPVLAYQGDTQLEPLLGGSCPALKH